METAIILPEIKKVSAKENSITFEIEPLFPGFGMTVGNSLRRVLLSSLPGVAPYKVKIAGASHEFSTLPHVKEDVVEILLNLKSLRFKLHEGEEAKATLEVSGEKKVTAKDFKMPSNLELASPEQYIATLSRGGKLKIDLWINHGVGYVPVERREDEKSEIGAVTLDALYSPVKKVHYEVENTRVGRMTNYDKVTIEITTDGTMDAARALEACGKILEDHFHLIANANLEAEKTLKKEKAKEKAKKTADLRQLKIEEVDFSNRTANALLNNGIKTVGGLLRTSKEKISEMKGLGTKAVTEIEKVLDKSKLKLKK
jgi:DNA-directed RNA polymerase subunit alpha